MDKEQEINEMTNVLKEYTKENHITASFVILEDYAEALYNAGYGKVENYKKEIERLKGVIAMTEQHYKPELPFMDEFDKEKQQAIKECLQSVLKVALTEEFLVYTDKEIYQEIVKKVAK